MNDNVNPFSERRRQRLWRIGTGAVGVPFGVPLAVGPTACYVEGVFVVKTSWLMSVHACERKANHREGSTGASGSRTPGVVLHSRTASLAFVAEPSLALVPSPPRRCKRMKIASGKLVDHRAIHEGRLATMRGQTERVQHQLECHHLGGTPAPAGQN